MTFPNNLSLRGGSLKRPISSLIEGYRAMPHVQKVWLYMVIVFGHFSEHLAQIYQIYIMGWLPKDSGGLLGFWFPALAQTEVLHFAYNGFQLAGLILLMAGFCGMAAGWWKVALIAQCWHFFEHMLLQVQWLTGIYLFGAAQQMGIGQLWFPRAELHLLYNVAVFLPTMIATMLYLRSVLANVDSQSAAA